jgi:hypothetical protein
MTLYHQYAPNPKSRDNDIGAMQAMLSTNLKLKTSTTLLET